MADISITANDIVKKGYRLIEDGSCHQCILGDVRCTGVECGGFAIVDDNGLGIAPLLDVININEAHT